MTSSLRTLLLCAILLLSSSLSLVLSFSDSSLSLSSPDVSSTEALLLRIDPSEDAESTEILFVQSAFGQSHIDSAPLPTSTARRTDSMEGGPHTAATSQSDNEVNEVKAAAVEAEAHTMHTMQSTAQFTMERLTAAAPWSYRIQPGLMYRQREIAYTQVRTGLRVRLGAGYLLMYEGAMTNRSGDTLSVENDVWVSNDDGRTWDLIAGRSEYGLSGPISAVQNQTFNARSGSNNCNDPQSDLIISLGGNDARTTASTNASYTSNNGINWVLQNSSVSFAPVRHFSSCDITDRGDIILIGGHFHASNNQPADYLLNDVWRGTGALDSAYAITWRRQTAAAPFAAREEHLVLVGWSSFFKKEIIYVIGGRVQCNNANCYDGATANDVWASSDYGTTWAQLTAGGGFGPRWGHGGWITQEGVLVIWGGLNSPTGRYADTVTQRGIWASFDGGYTWTSCSVANTEWIRGEQGAVVNAQGRLVIAAGYAYAEVQPGDQVRYNDVWRSTFSIESTNNLRDRCGGVTPAAGVGLRRWPTAVPSTTNTLTFTPATVRAPWSPRYKAGLLLMSQPLTYKTPDGVTANTGADWLLMYEGQGLVSSDASTNENDVYASADSGQTWVLISGYSFRGQTGFKSSAYPLSSFSGSISSANCEDPTTDDVYSIGGLRWSGGAVTNPPTPGADFWSTNDVWYSSNALVWNRTNTANTRVPQRDGATCDVGHSRNIILIGGRWRRFENGDVTVNYYNDVWQSNNNGRTFTQVTARAQFAPRRDHAMQIVYSDYYGVDLVYVVGGRGLVGTTVTAFNDVWVSSDAGRSWKPVIARAQFSPRFEASVVVTSTGAMLTIGGRGQSDMWASLNGGLKWSLCNTVANQSVTDSSAVTLTADDRLVIASGSPRADVLLLDQRLTDAATVRRYCPGASLPEDGAAGLRMVDWGNSTNPDDPTPNTGSSSAGGLSGLAIVGIVAAVLVALAVAYGYWRWQQKNSGSGATNDPIALLGGTHNGSVEGQSNHSNALDSSLMHDTDSHSSL